LSDLAWGKDVDYVEYKGTGGDWPTSRVLKVKRNSGKVWFCLESGPGEVIGEGAVKPTGQPEAWEVVTFRRRMQGC